MVQGNNGRTYLRPTPSRVARQPELGQGDNNTTTIRISDNSHRRREFPTPLRIYPSSATVEFATTGPGSIPLIDENNNSNQMKSLTKLFKLDKNENVRRKSKFSLGNGTACTGFQDSVVNKIHRKYLKPQPKLWQHTCHHHVIGFMFFWTGQRKRIVRFPDEVVKKAESDQRLGETMGKLREVKRSTKHRQKLSALLKASGTHSKIPDENGKPDLTLYHVKAEELPYPPDWDSWLLADNPNCLCDCLLTLCNTKRSTKAGFTPEQAARVPPAEHSDKFKVTEQKFCRCLDTVEDFVVGNMKTIDYTLGVIGYLPLGSSSQLQQEGRFNHIAAGIWFFTFAIQDLFQDDHDLPTKSEFNELLSDFAHLAVFIDRVARRTLLFAELLCAFGEAALDRLQCATDRLHVKTTIMDQFQLKPLPKFGQGLELKDPEVVNYYKVVSRPVAKGHDDNPWIPFSSQSKFFKMDYLKEFLAKLQNRMVTLNGQMRFLTDDIFEQEHHGPPPRSRSKKKQIKNGQNSKKDAKKQTFLSALHSLDIVMYRFSIFEETIPSYEEALLETMESVASDTFELLGKSQRIIEAIVEVRDMVELGLNYMKEVYGISFDGLIPEDVEFDSKGKRGTFSRFWSRFCCLCVTEGCSPAEFHSAQAQSSSSSEEFFKTVFPFHLRNHSMMDSQTGHEFALKKANTAEKTIIGPIKFQPEGPEVLLGTNISSNPGLTLEPALGRAGVWDDLSNLDITRLKDQVKEPTLDITDIPPEIVAEIKRREDFKREF